MFTNHRYLHEVWQVPRNAEELPQHYVPRVSKDCFKDPLIYLRTPIIRDTIFTDLLHNYDISNPKSQYFFTISEILLKFQSRRMATLNINEKTASLFLSIVTIPGQWCLKSWLVKY